MVLTRTQRQQWLDMRARAERFKLHTTWRLNHHPCDYAWMLGPHRSWEETEPTCLAEFPTQLSLIRLSKADPPTAYIVLKGCVHPYFIMCDRCSPTLPVEDPSHHRVKQRALARTVCQTWNRVIFVIGKPTGQYGFCRTSPLKVFSLLHMPPLSVSHVETENGTPKPLGSMSYDLTWTFANARSLIETAELLGFDFQFVDFNKCRMPVAWEKVNKIADYDGKLTIIPLTGHGDKPGPKFSAHTVIGHSSHASNGLSQAASQSISEPGFDGHVDARVDGAPCYGDGDGNGNGDGDWLVDEPPATEVPAVEEDTILPIAADPILDPCDLPPGFHVSFLSTLMPPLLQRVWSHNTKLLEEHKIFTKRTEERWRVRTFDRNGVPCGSIQCGECPYVCNGSSKHLMDRLSISNAFGNFRRAHITSDKHIDNVAKNQGISADAAEIRKRAADTCLRDACTLEQHVQIVATLNQAVPVGLPVGTLIFQIIGDLEKVPVDLAKYKVRCIFCNDYFVLVPTHKNLRHNLQEHVEGCKHLGFVARSLKPSTGAAISTGRAGRPLKADSRDIRQRSIQGFLSRTQRQSGESSSSRVSAADPAADKGKGEADEFSILCWGLWLESVKYGNETRPIKEILDDQSRPNQKWWAEPGIREEVYCLSANRTYKINGLFRHRDCRRVSRLGGGFKNLMCTPCFAIRNKADFRLRVFRESRAIEKRGRRGTANGRTLKCLTIGEYNLQCKSYRNRLRKELVRGRQQQHRLLMLQARVPTLGEVCKEAASRGDVIKFCQNIVLAHKTGAFGGRSALWDLFRDTAANLNKPDRGNRYRDGTRLLCQALLLNGGRRVIDCLTSNGIGPSLNTLQRDRRGMIVFQAGIVPEQFMFISEIFSQLKTRFGIKGPVPCFFAEDETCVKRTVRWLPKSDRLLGFCGPKSTDHQCCTGLTIKVGEGEAGFKKITDSFENYVIGHQARCVIVNPMVAGFPRLLIMATGTCNKFKAKWVRRQWNSLKTLWDEHCLLSVGPLLGHASDGDSRRRKLMLQDYIGKNVEGPREPELWEGWKLTHSVVTNGFVSHAYGLHDQDFIHNTKKLVGPLDSVSRALKLGAFSPDLSHVITAYFLYKHDEHGLNHEDILRTDRQNWASAQRLCSRKVVTTLRELRLREDAKVEMSHGTEVYMSICADYVDIFLNTRLTLRERVVLCGKVSFFFRLWRLWCFHGDHLVGGATQPVTFGKSCIPMQTFLDVQMSVHFVVLLVVQFRDKYRHLPLPLDLTGSDACEQFFSKVGGMKGHERSYDIAELVDCATNLNRMAAMDLTEGILSVGKSHRKHRAIWMDLHLAPAQPGDQPEVLPSQSDYTGIETNGEVVAALKEGYVLAREICRELQMAPGPRVLRKDRVWWDRPWVTEDLGVAHGGWRRIKVSDLVEDPEVEGCAGMPDDWVHIVAPPSRSVAEEEDPDCLSDTDTEMEIDIATNEVREVTSSMFHTVVRDGQPRTVPRKRLLDSTAPAEKVVPTVCYEGRHIYKSTLVSQLVGNPHLSKDRLTRVKKSLYFNNETDTRTAREGVPTMPISNGHDCGVFFIEDPVVPEVETPAVRGRKKMGKALKGRRRITAGEAEAEAEAEVEAEAEASRAQPVNVATVPTGPKYVWWIGRVQSIRRKYNGSWGRVRGKLDLLDRPGDDSACKVYFNWFKPVEDAPRKFTYTVCDLQPIELNCVISTVIMTMDETEKGVFELSEDYASALDNFVKNKVG